MRFRWTFTPLALSIAVLAAFAGAQSVAGRTQPGTSRPYPLLAPEQIAKMPVTALPVGDFKLLTDNAGWVSTGNRLLWTTDNGADWKDITPPAPAGADPKDEKLSGVFFLDAHTGWLLSASATDDTDPDGQPIAYYTHLMATTDGGATWSTVSRLPILSSSGEVTGEGSLKFSDRLHGWVDIGTARSGVLFATSDGGRTWQIARSQPGIGSDMVSPTAKDLWMAGGRDYKLFATHDGANTFQEVSMPLPAGIDPAAYPVHGLPVFTSSLNGYEPVTYVNGDEKSAEVLFATTDGGHTWKADRVVTNLDPSTAERNSPSAIVGSTWLFSFAPEGSQSTLLRISPFENKTATADNGGHDGLNGCDLSFLTPDEGWMNCAGRLTSTMDGGATWTGITPRIRSGSLNDALTTDPVTPLPAPRRMKTNPLQLAAPNTVSTAAKVIDQHLGFDSTDVLSAVNMGIWWKSSPYFDVGFYLPNSPNRHNDPTLAANKGQGGVQWVSAVKGQGWGLFPIWYGLQAPCPFAGVTYASYISTTINGSGGAIIQGEQQAKEAYASATSLGLEKSAVFVELEPYTSPAPAACSAAVSAYVFGFVWEWHRLGGSTVGAYASAEAASTDIYNSKERPDNIWIVNASGRVTVWNLNARGLNQASYNTPLTDNMWAHHQRMHQYQASIEKWGSVPAQKVNDDIIDAAIDPSTGVKEFPAVYDTSVNDGTAGSWISGIANGVDNSTGLHTGNAVGTYYVSDTAPFPQYYPDSYPSDGFSYLGAKATSKISFSGAFETYAAGVNNLGQIVGSYDVIYDNYGDAKTHGFYAPSKTAALQTLDYPGALATSLNGINDAGWIVGNYVDTNEIQHCALWKPPYTNAPTSFDPPGAGVYNNVYATCSGSNGLGQIVGSVLNSDGSSSTPYLDDAESGNPGTASNFSTPPTPDGVSIDPVGINNNGQIAGSSTDTTTGVTSQFLSDLAQDFFIALPNPGGNALSLSGINDEAQMAGTDASGGGIIVSALPTKP